MLKNGDGAEKSLKVLKSAEIQLLLDGKIDYLLPSSLQD